MAKEGQFEELTSAEAGFMYAAGCCEGFRSGSSKVDEVVAKTLTEAWPKMEADGWDEQRQALKVAGFEQWWRRGAPGACEDRRRILQWARDVVDGGDGARRVSTVMARRQSWRVLRQLGGDLSPMGRKTVDVRRWLSWEDKERLVSKLVVVGGVLVGALKQAVIRRRVALSLRQLPPKVHERVRRGLEKISTLDEAVERRVYEVYRRISGRGHGADAELAIIGLFFLVNAEVFRRNAAVERLEKLLPDVLSSQCRAFRRACIASRKPELSVALADTLGSVMAALDGE